MTLWEIDIHPRSAVDDREAARVRQELTDLGLATSANVRTAQGYLVDGELARDQIERLARELLVDPVVEQEVIGVVGDDQLDAADRPHQHTIHVLRRAGVMDPVAQTAEEAIRQRGWNVNGVRTLRKYWFSGVNASRYPEICRRVLANEIVDECIDGPLPWRELPHGSDIPHVLRTVTIRDLNDQQLLTLSRGQQLHLFLEEMQVIRHYYRELGREPTDIELETIAQTWSEHCCHKTLTGPIKYTDERGERLFTNLLKETVFAATQTIRTSLGSDDWCVSVFEDNAGIVRFHDKYHVAFKVETHNHPSALEPYGGASTGLGGVIRDILGTGLGAQPVCNTDVFCFAPPDLDWSQLPAGVLHPRRVIGGVVAGVRDYGNRMGIPTVSGAVYFDERYLGNPLVYCGCVGLIPVDRCHKQPKSGDYIVTLGGRTGRDGIHGATFSSVELHSESEVVSGGAVQIGNAITEKMLMDVMLRARDRGLYRAVTDCGAGGFSSAVGEMAAELGAEVDLDLAPLKYSGLTYTEIWISESQERMVLAVPPAYWPEFQQLCADEGVEAAAIGRFSDTGRLLLRYRGETVGELSMPFLHDRRPRIARTAEYRPRAPQPLSISSPSTIPSLLLEILSMPNIASKEWIIRQYDHEVQGTSVIKPLVGRNNDGPGDAAVIRPVHDSHHGLAIACGMNPHYGDHDTYAMAASAIDEAIRNCVAVGADPQRIALLDNFCWGNTQRPSTLGSLVRAATACHDVAIAFQSPFISGKDSLNNEFRAVDGAGNEEVISIPASLLISAIGYVPDVRRCVTMDWKEPNNILYIVGETHDELGGSHYAVRQRELGGRVPQLDVGRARSRYGQLHRAIHHGIVRACHDLSEGGLAVAVAEMAIAGQLGAAIELKAVPHAFDENVTPRSNWDTVLLFSESNSRLICEVAPQHVASFEAAMSGTAFAPIGRTAKEPQLTICGCDGSVIVQTQVAELDRAWRKSYR